MRILLAVVVGAAIVAALAWQHYHSKEARIERAYDACMAQFGGSTAARPSDAGAAGPTTPPTAADALGKAMQDLVRGVTSGMSGAVCGAVRDACRADFDGVVCRNAIAGFH